MSNATTQKVTPLVMRQHIQYARLEMSYGGRLTVGPTTEREILAMVGGDTFIDERWCVDECWCGGYDAQLRALDEQ